MTISHVGHRGYFASKTSDSGSSIRPTSDISAGDVVIITFASDNQSTTQGATTAVSFTDDQSNTYKRAAEYTRTHGSAADGVTGAVFYSVLSTGLAASTDYIHASYNSCVSKSWSIEVFSYTAPEFEIESHNYSFGTGTTPSVTLSGLISRAYLWIGLDAVENKSNALSSDDPDYNTLTAHGNTAGGADTCTAGFPAYRLYTGTGDTFSQVVSSCDYVIMLVAFFEKGGTQFQQSISGGITPAGAVTKQIAYPSLSGGSTPTGLLTKQIQPDLNITEGSLLFGSGTLTKQAQPSLAGSLSSSGTLLRLISSLRAGDLLSAGALLKEVRTSLTGAFGSAGIVTGAKTFLKSVEGTLSSAGALLKEVQMKGLAGTLSEAGALTKQIQKKDLAGTFSSAGDLIGLVGNWIITTIVRPINRHLNIRIFRGDFTPAGAQYYKSVTGDLISAGALLRNIQTTKTGTLSSSGLLTRLVGHSLSGSSSSTGTLSKLIGVSGLSGASSMSGALSKLISTSLTGTLSSSGLLQAVKVYVRNIAGDLLSAGALIKEIRTENTGTLSTAGAVLKLVSTSLLGTVTSSGLVIGLKLYVRSISGTLTSSGVLARLPQIRKTGTVSSTGSLVKETRKNLAGTISSAGTLSAIKVFLQTVAGALGLSGLLDKLPIKSLGGSTAPTGSITKGIAKSDLSGSTTPTGLLQKRPFLSFLGTLNSSASLSYIKVILRSLDGTLSSSGSLLKEISRGLLGTLSSTGALVKEARTSLSGVLSSAATLSGLKIVVKILTGTLNFVGVLVKNPRKTLSGTLSSAGTLTKSTAVSFIGTLTTAATLVGQWIGIIYQGVIRVHFRERQFRVKFLGGRRVTFRFRPFRVHMEDEDADITQ